MTDTIKHPDAFDKSQWRINCPHCNEIIGFDGIFNWGWVLEAIGYNAGRTQITPMDFDGVIERRYHYLIFETKDVNKDIPLGQVITLDNLRTAKSFTVMRVWGKENPAAWEAEFGYTKGGRVIKKTGVGEESAKDYVSRWFRWADEALFTA